MPRFMMFVKGDPKPGQLPSQELIDAMTSYNEELAKAGVLLDLSGLRPSAEGARVRFSAGGKRTVIDGPFAEAKEIVAGYWLIQAKSLDEAIEWAKRVPFEGTPFEESAAGFEGDPVIEVRQVFELEELGDNAAIDRAKELAKQLGKK